MSHTHKPKQAAGFCSDDLTTSVLEALRYIRDEGDSLRRMTNRKKVQAVRDALKPLAERCGVQPDDFGHYLSKIVGANI